MLRLVATTLLVAAIASAYPEVGNKPAENEPQKVFYIAERQASHQPAIQQPVQQQKYSAKIQEQRAENTDKQQQQQPQIDSIRQNYQFPPLARQQYFPDLQYDLTLLEPQFQLPGYNFVQEKQPYPRVQPQILLYGGTQGQPFLLQPGSPPPHNFLVPQQPGPNIILRDVPPRPVFVAGYPKPAHIPPVEKDAEEIPTNPAKIPPLDNGKKPEKLETFNEGKGENPTKSAGGEAEVLAAADKTPNFNQKPLRPGQRFFILNGQPLFSNYAYQPYPNIPQQQNLRYAAQPPLPAYPQNGPAFLPQGFTQPQKQEEVEQHVPIQNFLLRNTVTGQISNVAPNAEYNEVQPQAYDPSKFSQNVIALNQPENFPPEVFFRSGLPLNVAASREAEPEQLQLRFNDNPDLGYFQYQSDDLDNEAVVIDAKQDEPNNGDTESEVIRPAKIQEPSIAQAQPGAIALAGPGGTAGASPRGTALVGKGGLAVSSPQATAVAGPSKNIKPSSEEKNKKPTNKRN